MKQILLTVLFLFIFLFGHSCDCDLLKKIEKDDSTYQFIFKGRVVDTLTKDRQGVASFVPIKIFLGAPSDTLRIRYDNATDCLMSFAPNETWLIYAVMDKFKRLCVHFCGHSRKFISVDKNQDHYYQVRNTTFEQEDSILNKMFPEIKMNSSDDLIMPSRQLEHPDRGTAIWFILAALPVLFLLWWLLKKYLK